MTFEVQYFNLREMEKCLEDPEKRLNWATV